MKVKFFIIFIFLLATISIQAMSNSSEKPRTLGLSAEAKLAHIYNNSDGAGSALGFITTMLILPKFLKPKLNIKNPFRSGMKKGILWGFFLNFFSIYTLREVSHTLLNHYNVPHQQRPSVLRSLYKREPTSCCTGTCKNSNNTEPLKN